MSDALLPLGLMLPARVADLEIRARAAQSLTDQVRASLPEALGSHLLSASCRGDALSVTMDSAAWCPQVRLSETQLQAALKANGGPDFVKLRVRVGRVHPAAAPT